LVHLFLQGAYLAFHDRYCPGLHSQTFVLLVDDLAIFGPPLPKVGQLIVSYIQEAVCGLNYFVVGIVGVIAVCSLLLPTHPVLSGEVGKNGESESCGR